MRNFLIWGCVILQVLDAVFTGYAIEHSSLGLSVEGNFLIRAIISQMGVWTGLLFVKMFAVSAILYLSKIKASSSYFVIIFGFYLPVVLLWAKVIFVDKLP